MLKVLKPGFFSTIQDLGRFGYRDMGVPVSGVMDSAAVQKANMLLENDPNAAVLEMTMTGPKLEFELSTFICISGADLSPKINGESIENYCVVSVSKGDVLSFERLVNGFRGYLAIKGGFKTTKVLGSWSQYFPVTKQKNMILGSEIPYDETISFSPSISEIKTMDNFDQERLEVNRAPEFSFLTDTQLAGLFGKSFTISKENNRMAYQLTELIDADTRSILTSGTLPGTVQLTPSGRLIILMKDGQTTGGYPRILQLSEASICVLAQKKYRDSISFKLL